MRTCSFLVTGLLLVAPSLWAGGGDVHSVLRREIARLPAPAGGESIERGAAPSARKAFFLSLVVPGLGQLYSSGWNVRSWAALRAAGYAAFEGTAWVQQQRYRNRGWDQQAEYRAYAMEHWHWKEMCADWNNGDGAIDDDPFEQDPGDPDDFYIDTDAEYLEFYEDIHKLEKWICGWDDYPDEAYVSTDGIEETPMRVFYRSMRHEQNDLMTTAQHWQWGIVFNHIVSAFDALFTARRAGDLAGGGGPAIRVGSPIGAPGGTVALAWRF